MADRAVVIGDERPVVLLAGAGRGADHPTGAANLAALLGTVAGVEAMLDYAAEDRYLATVTAASRRLPGPTPRSVASPRRRPRRPG